MHSVLLLLLVGCVLAVPGIAAALAAFPPGDVSIVTRLAAAFGLGYAAAGGCAFILAAAHAFWLASFLPLWLVVSAALWVLALRRASISDHAGALRADLSANRLPLLLGTVVVAALLIVRFSYVHIVGGPHYVYYLNGVEIANSHGVPAATLEYGQSWPPATDKVFLDAFTGIVVLLGRNPVTGPGVLLWISVLGSALGLWAAGWELGLRRTGGLLPLLLLGNKLIFSAYMSGGYGQYRAEDFGRAVAFCALALGIVAIREGGWRRAAVAGVVLAAASGSHLISVLVVVMALCFVGVAELLRGHAARARMATLRDGIALAGIGGVLGTVIRVFAGGSFGLGGASNQSSYSAIHTSFDATAYLSNGTFPRWDAPGGDHWYIAPSQVIDQLMSAATGANWGLTAWLLLLAAALLTAAALFLLIKTDLRTVGVVGVGLMAGVLVIGLFFSYRYHVYIEATFGVRRMKSYASIGLILVGLGIIEALLLLLDRASARTSIAAAVIPVIFLTVWLLPSAAVTHYQQLASQERLQLATWVRTHTPCGARFLVNQRPEGTMTALTGRNDLSEGMGPFLRADRLPYVVNLMLGARKFFADPLRNEAFLRQHDITYVVVARGRGLIGYRGPIGRTAIHAISAAPFLHLVRHSRSAPVYKVVGARVPPASSLLKGPYLHCKTTPARF